MNGLSPETVAYLRSATREKRKRLGQFFTPGEIRERLVARLGLRAGMRVLDPGVGTGEFLLSCASACEGLDLHGWDVDPEVLRIARRAAPDATITKRDALEPYSKELFDVVVGNPPYFEVRGAGELRERYSDVIAGRPNIFSMFFRAGLSLLKPGGILGFVVPPSMNNGAYFAKLRAVIARESAIEHLEILDSSGLFFEAQQSVQLIVLRKGARSNRFLYVAPAHETILLFSESPRRLRDLFRGRTSLFDLGYRAVTGTIVWNQHKPKLRRERVDGAVPLIWSHNIAADGILRFQPHSRPQFVIASPILRGPAVVVNRVTGSVGTGALRAGAVPRGFEFVAENHVNVILPRPGVQPQIGWRELLQALRAPGVRERVRLLTGNTQISARELNHLLPLDTAQKPARRAARRQPLERSRSRSKE